MKKYEISAKKPVRLSKTALFSSISTFGLCMFLGGVIIYNMVNVEMLRIEQLAYDQAFRTNVVISKQLYKTNSIAAIVMHSGGEVIDFERTASLIAADPAIFNVLVAPGGIVSHVYPMSGGHDAVLGWNFFEGGLQGNSEAARAIGAGSLMLSGPFVSAQGSKVLAGRLPVYIESPMEGSKFWGLVSVTLQFPEVLLDTELETFRARGLEYEIWRVNPDTDERQVIMTNSRYGHRGERYIENTFTVVNAEWNFKVWPVRAWHSYPQTLVILVIVLLISLLVLFIVQNNFKLTQIKGVLEDMANSDPLTGVYNRRRFMELARVNTERTRRQGTECYVILFDLDRFKSVNDTHGHMVGDKVLVEAASRIKAMIRPYDLFARYGGEEFIIFASELDKKSVTELVERLRLCLYDSTFVYNDDISISISASFGIAHLDNYDLDKAILRADKALYRSKDEGRNKVAFG
jgi:diguanylate cyclase (GGDEF)-like protein